MNFKRLLHSKLGITIISIMLGIGLAGLFQKTCHDKKCLKFNGPVISDIPKKTFKHGEKCYKYEFNQTTCNSNKQIVDIHSENDMKINGLDLGAFNAYGGK